MSPILFILFFAERSDDIVFMVTNDAVLRQRAIEH